MNGASTALSVSALNEYIKSVIDSDPALRSIYIKGEISNFKNHFSTGHYYFSLKDDSSVIKAVMFRSAASHLRFMPENGMLVMIRGRVSSFVRDGQYQIYAEEMEPDGVGSLYIAYEQLKRRLESEGLFDNNKKKPLPKIPSRVGVITSATGAAVRDIINVTGRRFPFAQITVYPALVQGDGAVSSLISGLKYFNTAESADVIIIGRGGGSIEDLWAFNSEQLAREIAASRIPVISAVGHETDFTICDFVADKRAPTPSAAAEIAVPDTDELKHKILNVIKRESALLSQKIIAARAMVGRFSESRVLRDPTSQLDDRRMRLTVNTEKLFAAVDAKSGDCRSSLAAVAGKLSALDPMAVLSRGFGALYGDSGAIIKSVGEVSVGDGIYVRLSDGTLSAKISKIEMNNNGDMDNG